MDALLEPGSVARRPKRLGKGYVSRVAARQAAADAAILRRVLQGGTGNHAAEPTPALADDGQSTEAPWYGTTRRMHAPRDSRLTAMVARVASRSSARVVRGIDVRGPPGNVMPRPRCPTTRSRPVGALASCRRRTAWHRRALLMRARRTVSYTSGKHTVGRAAPRLRSSPGPEPGGVDVGVDLAAVHQAGAPSVAGCQKGGTALGALQPVRRARTGAARTAPRRRIMVGATERVQEAAAQPEVR